MSVRVLAVDPGYDRCGVAVVERTDGSEALIYSSCITTSKKDTFATRLGVIGAVIEKLVQTHKPQSVVVEKTFFSKNQKTALEVSHARGVILYEAARARLPVFEYTPPQIKLATTGYGASTKAQVEKMVAQLISLPKNITSDDEIDAIAVGLTHLAHTPSA